MPNSRLVTLHRYFIWANRLREYFDTTLHNHDLPSDMESTIRWFINDPGLFQTHWYASLYVVIEAWLELGFRDPEIDNLLGNERMVSLLRRYRNGTFHFQPDYFSEKLFEMVREPGSATWVREVHAAFGKHFMRLEAD